jgi:RraA family protein
MSIQEIGKPGFRFKTDFERPPATVVERYRNLMNETGCLTGNVGDCIGRCAAMDARVQSLAPGMKLVGPALTVRVPPTDNLMIHKALTLIKPGDVLVIEGGGNHSWALLGWLMVSTARKLGVAGIVADGCVRDAQEIRKSGFPVFAAGLSPNGPFKEGPGEINYPISCGGQVVRPGDMIVADDDGVVVMRQELAPEIIDEVHKIIQREDNRLKEIEAGQVIRPGIDEMLAQKGVK